MSARCSFDFPSVARIKIGRGELGLRSGKEAGSDGVEGKGDEGEAASSEFTRTKMIWFSWMEVCFGDNDMMKMTHYGEEGALRRF